MTAEQRGPWTEYRTDRAHRRASDADRERVIDTLSVEYVAGRLAKEEFLTRASQALGSRTHGELAAISLSIPPRPGEPPTRRPAKPRNQSTVDAKSIAWVVFLLLMPTTLGIGFVTHNVVFYCLFVVAFLGTAVTAQPDS
jgi:hypothetical protein